MNCCIAVNQEEAGNISFVRGIDVVCYNAESGGVCFKCQHRLLGAIFIIQM